MKKSNDLGSFLDSLPKEKSSPIQKIVPIKAQEQQKKFLMNMPVEVYNYLRQKAFDEDTDIKSLVLSAISKTYKIGG